MGERTSYIRIRNDEGCEPLGKWTERHKPGIMFLGLIKKERNKERMKVETKTYFLKWNAC